MDSFYIIALIKIAIVVGVLMHVLAYLQWVERKVIAHVLESDHGKSKQRR